MVTPTEQNLTELAPKVIALKLPFDLEQRILTFPFLHALRAYYPKSVIHFITPKKQIEVLNLLPFEAYYHEFDEDEISSIFDVHRFCVNARIHSVDLFISLTNSFPDACLGLGFRARQRLGFSDGWKTLVFNQKTLRPVNHHLVEDFLTLYKTHTGLEADPRIKVISRELTPIIKEWDTTPYIAINISPLRGAQIDEEWIHLISLFDSQKIVLFASDEQEKAQEMMDLFIKHLPPNNTYENFIYKNWIDLGKMLAFARGVITFSGPLAAFSAYVGTRTLIMYDNDDPQRTGPFYFISDVAVISATDTSATNPVMSTGVLKNRITFKMDVVFEKALSFFRL